MNSNTFSTCSMGINICRNIPNSNIKAQDLASKEEQVSLFVVGNRKGNKSITKKIKKVIHFYEMYTVTIKKTAILHPFVVINNFLKWYFPIFIKVCLNTSYTSGFQPFSTGAPLKKMVHSLFLNKLLRPVNLSIHFFDTCSSFLVCIRK